MKADGGDLEMSACDAEAARRERARDRWLIRLALLAPLLLVLLSKWQASLVSWYLPWGDDPAAYLDARLDAQISALPELGDAADATTLLVVTDRACPCTRATLNIIKDAMARSARRDLRLKIVDIGDAKARTPAWRRVVAQLPSTPTLLVTEGQRLRYAGPVNSGNLCTTRVQELLGLAALQTSNSQPVINWLQQGCYCRLPRND